MLVFHTGNFTPFPQNNGTGGTKEDSTVVEVCTRLAQRGYVAASVDYRLGWNPVDPSQDFRKFFLINAAYRGVQDARTAVRYMRLLAQDQDNPYNIDPDKIGLWGVGTGGYIVAATATIDEYIEIAIPKFFIDLGAGPQPMVVESINGDINGTSVGMVPPGYPVLPAGDTLCYPNHVNYADGSPISSDVSFIVNNGGALGDISWLDEGTPPWVSFHVPTDPFAPYTTGVLTVPGTGDPDDPTDDFAVVEVSGSYDIQKAMTEQGFNDVFESVPNAAVDYRDVANSRNDGYTGLFPFPSTNPLQSAPWDFYAEDNPGQQPPPFPQLDRELALTYWDTVFAFTGVRACVAMDLGCNLVGTIDRLDANEIGLTIAPNPANEAMFISAAPEHKLKSIEMYDASGRMIDAHFNINDNIFTLERNGASSGIYFLRLRFEEGVTMQKVIFN
jgi:hypothetical protein